MNFNVYLNKDIGEAISKFAKKLHRSRNSIITEALELWLTKQKKVAWPKHFFDFDPIQDVPDFKALRSELTPPSEDPLA